VQFKDYKEHTSVAAGRFFLNFCNNDNKICLNQRQVAENKIWKPKSGKRSRKTARELPFCLVLVCLENKSAILKFSREKPAVNFFVTRFNPTRSSMR